MDLAIKGRVALVGGGSKGMGLATAHDLAADGVAVALVARNQGPLDEAVAAIREKGGKAIGVAGDMMIKEDVQRVVARVRDELGHPDIVINNTNVTVPPAGRGFDNTSDDEFRGAVEEYVMAPVFVIRETLQHMREQRWGRYVIITSICVKTPHYDDHWMLNNLRTSTVALAKTLANENAEYNVTFNNVAPGPVLTPAFDEYLTALADDRNSPVKWAEHSVPMRRCAVPEEVSGMIAFLASERASYITGQTVVIDGGYTRVLF